MTTAAAVAVAVFEEDVAAPGLAGGHRAGLLQAGDRPFGSVAFLVSLFDEAR